MIPKWEQGRVLRSLEAIEPPYEEIAEDGKRPWIEESEVNLALAEALHSRDFISQFKQEKKGIQIITKRQYPSV